MVLTYRILSAPLLLQLLVSQMAFGQAPVRSPASLLAEVREATGGDAWNRIAELHAEGTISFGDKTGTIVTADDLRTGANADRIYLPGGVRLENHLDGPAGDWEQDEGGDVRLSPSAKDRGEIDDLYIHRHGWWEPNFGGATIAAQPAQTLEGVTYDPLFCKVPGGGAGFTLWINRSSHHIDRIVGADGSATLFSDFHTVEGLTLPFRKEKGSGDTRSVVLTTELTALRRLRAEDFAPPFHDDYTMPASGQVTVPAEDGVTFGMKVNGRGPYPTVFDTGAVNGMSVRLAKSLGLKIDAPPVAFGAIGGGITVHTAHVDRIYIGGLVVRDQNFYILDLPSDSGDPEMIVGWELMRRFAVRFDFERGQLTLFDGPTFHYNGTGSAVPLLLHPHGNGMDIPASADGHAGSFILDTGNEIGLTLNAGFVAEGKLVSSLGAHFHGYNGRGFGGLSPEAWYARLHTFRIGDAEITEPVVRMQTKEDGPNEDAGNIGSGVLSRFVMTVDAMRGKLYLEKNADWNKREVFNRAGLVVDPANGADEIMTVLPGSPAAGAGLRAGDRITSINGRPPADNPNDPVFLGPVGTVLHLAVRRGSATISREVKLADVL